MPQKIYSFNLFNEYAENGISRSLYECVEKNKTPIIVCVGSDLVLGDSLGPLVGTLLKKKGCGAFVYGTLNYPVTAKEVEYAKTYLKQMHPDCAIIAVDAAIGDSEDVGIIRVFDKGLKPGLGVNKDLGVIGDASVVGIVAGKSLKNKNLFNLTRLNLVFRMAEKISDGICSFLSEYLHSTGQKENFGA